MSERDLPEELLHEVLSLCLTVDLADFFQVPNIGARNDESSSKRSIGIPLVSRRWWRIGTPLLYSSLRITDTLHAETVAQLLLRDPGLGRAVRNLRIGDGVEDRLLDVAKSTPNVQRLYIALDHTSNDAAESFAQALPLLRPRELYLIDMSRFMRLYPFFPWRPSMRPDEAVRVVGRVMASNWNNLGRIFLGPDSEAALSLAAVLGDVYPTPSLATEVSAMSAGENFENTGDNGVWICLHRPL